MIDKATKEIKQDDDKTVYSSLDELAYDLPDHSPRFVLLSYPLTLVRSELKYFLYKIMLQCTPANAAALCIYSLPDGCRYPTSSYTTCQSPATAS